MSTVRKHTWLTFEHDLPCGHTVSHALYNERPDYQTTKLYALPLVSLVNDWIRHIETYHKCERVGPNLPNGC